MTAYAPPLDRLLPLGRPEMGADWRDYRALGLGPEHGPELIRMMVDPALNEAPGESPEVWAPLHAWRALGELRALEAAGPFLDLLDAFHRDDDGGADWMSGDAARFFGLLGPPALPALTACLADPARDMSTRWVAASGLTEIAREHPDARPAVVATLTDHVERAAENDRDLNGAVVSELITLQATAALPAIERAFAAGLVEEDITGDWEYVQADFGLREKPVRPRYPRLVGLADAVAALAGARKAEAQQRAQAKAKRKQERQAKKKKNRKKKR